jgi:aspartate ammonia-lyase
MIITALLPVIGYDRATELMTEFTNAGTKNMKIFLEEKLGKSIMEKAFLADSLTALGYRNG